MFSPVHVDGALHCDAGVLDAVNLWAAAELGATSIVAVDVMPGMPFSFVQGAMGFALSAVRRSTPRNVVDAPLILRPSRPLGPAASMLSWNPVRVRDWIRQGEDDAADFFLGGGLRRAA
jgi:predicted acylesterase/phospholipase RssA